MIGCERRFGTGNRHDAERVGPSGIKSVHGRLGRRQTGFVSRPCLASVLGELDRIGCGVGEAWPSHNGFARRGVVVEADVDRAMRRKRQFVIALEREPRSGRDDLDVVVGGVRRKGQLISRGLDLEVGAVLNVILSDR